MEWRGRLLGGRGAAGAIVLGGFSSSLGQAKAVVMRETAMRLASLWPMAQIKNDLSKWTNRQRLHCLGLLYRLFPVKFGPFSRHGLT
jgi:hypothetical protein